MAETRHIEQPSRPNVEPQQRLSEEPVEPAMTPINPNEARSAVTGHNARFVLAWGLFAVILAFVVVYFVFFA